jgi:antitoxin component YwqK of YwqJK toxin-antitoxin module
MVQTRSHTIGYKKLRNDYIAKLRILGQTNEQRDGVVDAMYSKYRTSKVKVLKIYHFKTREEIQEMNSIYDKSFIYRVGEIITIDVYNININMVCGSGIHYFKNEESALLWNMNPKKCNYNGIFKQWYENGQISCSINFVNGKRHGKSLTWYRNGNLYIQSEFNKDKLYGIFKQWYENGQLHQINEYNKDGLLNGKLYTSKGIEIPFNL